MSPVELQQQQAVRLTVLELAVKALFATHSQPQAARRAFEQLVAQVQASPAIMGSEELAERFRLAAAAALPELP